MISSFVTGIVAIAVCIINNVVTMKKADIEQDKRLIEIQAKNEQVIAVITCKIEELDRKQAIHNSVIERVYQLEKFASLMQEKQSVANHRIDDLEKKIV